MTKQETREYFAEKDRIFNAHKAAGVWPADVCEECKRRGGCCQYPWHHVGDNCTHCGNDERSIRPHR